MALIIEATRVLLQSDDALWYWLELTSDEGVVTPQSDGVAVMPPGGATAYAIVTSNTASTYRLSLSTEAGSVTTLFTLSPGVETPDTVNLDLSGTVYALTAWVEEGAATWTLDVAVVDIVATPSITVQPSGASIQQGDDFVFSVTATGGELSYQWYDDGRFIIGENSSSYRLIGASLNHAGTYTVKVSNGAGSVLSSSAALVVDRSPAPEQYLPHNYRHPPPPVWV